MLLGDINSDNAISIVDVVGLVRYILGEQYDNFVVTAADINGDGNITIADVINLINIILNDDQKLFGTNNIMKMQKGISVDKQIKKVEFLFLELNLLLCAIF